MRRLMFGIGLVSLLSIIGCVERSVKVEDSATIVDLVATAESSDVSWCVDDMLAVVESGEYGKASCREVDETGRGIFSLELVDDSREEYMFAALFPESALLRDDSVNVRNVRFEIASEQYPHATYHDIDADVRVARYVECAPCPDSLSMEFRRVVALGALELKNMPEEAFISEVKLTLPGDKLVAGECRVDMLSEQVSYCVAEGVSQLTLTFNEPQPASTPIYFACAPFELTGGETYSVEVRSGEDLYTQRVVVSEEDSVQLALGDVTTLSVTMPDPEPEPQTFTFRRVAKVTSGKSYLIAAERHIAEAIHSDYGYLDIEDGDKDDDGEIVVTSCENAFIFERVDGGYTIKQASDGSYLYQTGSYNSFNVASNPAEGKVWSVQAQNDNSFKITNKAVGKFVQYNDDYSTFGSYSTMQKYGSLPMLYELDGELVVEQPKATSSRTKVVDLDLPAVKDKSLYPDAQVVNMVVDNQRNYTAFYDTSLYTSLWVAYTLSADHMGDIKRPGGWSYNPYISTSDQVNLCSRSYNDDYSRGHLIPNASRNGNRDMQLQTFYVTNSVPQIQNGFNGGIWQRLESALQGVAQQESIYIVTGVSFSKAQEKRSLNYTTAKDDSKRVPVPNYFYKVVLKVETDESGAVVDATGVGFWFEHRSYSDSFEKYAVSIDQIEEWTGFDYFHALDDEIELTAEQNNSWREFKAW
ncbi:MAG: DNA/RNA non-specific endonuclease [Alistipes sp.]|nr:DNA/RNA non-specific endonuclease [Alistipes sp.]